ncbi:MlaD family protein [Paraburkholderia sp. BL10I2N1]|uniref:PqiB family protein n=1 Tax=Paraburkholderia sp. BL10I2N1 TaxID=1938796 RepID=UPI00105D0D13|nr:MlaD family protein [Paraburkholderia sp. BL10I2N1]TDN57827.1 paraquat-inducible protein B [Paraburkholderia sp. BL10I2N1]
MSDPRKPPDLPDLPEAIPAPRARWRFQVVWLVPIVAVLIGGWLAVKSVLEQGPTITITFKTGEGLEAGKTKIKFKDVDIGVIKGVTLSKDHKHVVATAEVVKDASDLLVDDTHFWVVRPRISGGTVSGLGTLLSGSFVGMDAGASPKARDKFTGLEIPPVIASDVPGRDFVLKSPDMGSLDVGTPIFYRRLQVGQITSFSLDPDGRSVTLHAFINAPYDRFVRPDTRFWHASGVDVALDTDGVRVNMQSIASILIGGVAFDTPDHSIDQPPAAVGTTFTLFGRFVDAMKRHDRIVTRYVAEFTDSVRGLTIGAPLDFRGITVGEVTGIYTRFSRETRKLSIVVEVAYYPERFTNRYESGPTGGPAVETENAHEFADYLVARGMRLQLRTGNLLTGQLYLAIDFFPDAPKAKIDWSKDPAEFPTVPGTLQTLQDSMSRLMTKLNTIPFDAIGKNTQQALQSANALLTHVDKDIVPPAKDTLNAAHGVMNSANSALQPDSELQQNVSDAMGQLAQTAAAVRTLADYLERHPEALVRGKSENKP